MMLTDDNLRDVYDSLVVPFQHPDPIGFITRALLLSNANPDFSGGGLVGFIPMSSKAAIEITGVPEIQSLHNNVVAALSIDRINFDRYGTTEDMIIALHFPESISNLPDKTSEHIDFINDIDESREDVILILEPPLATPEDVIKLLDDAKDKKLTGTRAKFFNALLNGRK